MRLSEKKKLIFGLLGIPVFCCAAMIIAFYLIAMNTGFPGRRGGPQDAFRHTFATAMVSRYFSPKAVEIVTLLCETDTDSPFDRMDIHNNRVGMLLGLTQAPIYGTVLEKIKAGAVNSEVDDQITWLVPENWSNGF